MNATKAGNRARRAVGEVTGTARKLAGSAQELEKKARGALASDPALRTEQRTLAAAGRTVSDVMQKCAADIREINRESAIGAIKGNAERWAERVKLAQAALRGVKVEDFNWGAIFTGSKAALIKAGLVSAQLVPAKGKHKQYRLPLNHSDGYMAACYGPTWGRIPPAWDASIGEGDEKGTYAVKVSFDWVRDMNIRERTERAFEEMNRPDVNMALLRHMVAEIPPLPLSVAVPDQIEKAKMYPKRGGK